MIDVAVPPPSTAHSMQVIDHEPGSWYVLTEGEDLYLDVRTGLSGSAFWLLLQLDEEETAAYQQSRKAFIILLVQKIMQRPQFHFMRNATIDKQKIAFDTLTAWRQGPRRPRL